MRTQENKGAAYPPAADELDRDLARLDAELASLLVFLEAYDRSRHPQRFEALRWQVPRLVCHRGALTKALLGLAAREV